MDSSSPVTHIGLCAGYGGIELGLHRAIRGMRTVALCEIEAFAIANLVSKMEAGLMDPAPIWPNLKTFPWAAFRDRVDILTGGYPCQPFSAAGQRKGKQDPRHLWPYIADGIRLLRPRCCFFENVEGHISLGLSDVIEDLAGMGYRTTWGIFSASECGAPHQRKRVFILAYRDGQRGQLQVGAHSREVAPCNHPCNAWPSRPGEQQYGWEPPRVVANSKCSERRQNYDGESEQSAQKANRVAAHGQAMGDAGSQKSYRISSRLGREEVAEARQSDGRQAESPLGGNADGAAGGMDYAELCVSCDNRTDELRLLGNGVVPATAERAFRVLTQELYTQPASS